MTTASDSSTLATARRSTGRVVAGWVLILPAIACCITELLIPTVQTFLLSLQNANPLSTGAAEFVGLENFRFIFSEELFGKSLGFTMLFVLLRLGAVALVPIFLAWAVSRLGRWARLGARTLLTLPIVLFMPVAISAVWFLALNPINGLFPTGTPLLAQPNSARLALLLIDALYTFGLACGLGLIFFSALWRQPDSAAAPRPKMFKPALVVWGIAILATIALTLPLFVQPFVMTRGGPVNSTITLGLWHYTLAFQFFRFGPAAALATLMLIMVIILGVIAALLIILARLRLLLAVSNNRQPTVDQAPPPSGKALPLIVLIITLLLSVAACGLSALPYGWVITLSFGNEAFTRLLENVPLAQVVINTLGPPAIAAIIQLGVAYLAALGIGALRPLGKFSPWLLLLFSPWLFISVLPLSLVSFNAARQSEQLNTFLGLMPPILFSAPALFILALFFGGHAARWQAAAKNGDSSAGAFVKHLILPSLPLAGVLLLFLLFAGWQQTVWPLIAANNPANATLSTALLQLMFQFATTSGPAAAALTLLIVPVVVFFFPLLAVFQIFYLDRLVWQAGAESPPNAVEEAS